MKFGLALFISLVFCTSASNSRGRVKGLVSIFDTQSRKRDELITRKGNLLQSLTEELAALKAIHEAVLEACPVDMKKDIDQIKIETASARQKQEYLQKVSISKGISERVLTDLEKILNEYDQFVGRIKKRYVDRQEEIRQAALQCKERHTAQPEQTSDDVQQPVKEPEIPPESTAVASESKIEEVRNHVQQLVHTLASQSFKLLSMRNDFSESCPLDFQEQIAMLDEELGQMRDMEQQLLGIDYSADLSNVADLVSSVEEFIQDVQEGYIDEEEALQEAAKECSDRRSMANEMYQTLKQRLSEFSDQFLTRLKLYYEELTDEEEKKDDIYWRQKEIVEMASDGVILCGRDVLPNQAFLQYISTDDFFNQMTDANAVFSQAESLLDDLKIKIYEFESNLNRILEETEVPKAETKNVSTILPTKIKSLERSRTLTANAA